MSLPTPFVRPEATTWSVEDILRRAKEGQLYIPVFQRSFRWDADDVRKLLDSIYRGYPVGDLLLWETDRTQGATTRFGPVSFPPATGRGFIIVDGQQRVTSLVAVLMREGAEDGRFNLFFDLEARRFVHLRARSTPPEHWLPLAEASDTVKFLEWLQARKLPGELVQSANFLVRSLRDYRLPVYVVHTQDEEQIREIFERMNTTGKSLRASEVFAALQRGRQDTDLRGLAAELEELGFGTFDEDWLLKAVAAILGVDVTRNLGEALRGVPADKVREGLADAARAIRSVVHFLREDAGILHIELLPYRFPLVPLTKFFHLVKEPSERSRELLSAWVWCGAFSQAHGRSDAPALRAALAQVTRDEEETVRKLLANTPRPEQLFVLQRHDFRSAATKLACAVLAAVLKPRHLITGEEMDVSALLNKRGANAYLPIVRTRVNGTSGTENRLLHEELAVGVHEALLRAPEEVLKSHSISRADVLLMANGHNEQFLANRRIMIESQVNQVREFIIDKMDGKPPRQVS